MSRYQCNAGNVHSLHPSDKFIHGVQTVWNRHATFAQSIHEPSQDGRTQRGAFQHILRLKQVIRTSIENLLSICHDDSALDIFLHEPHVVRDHKDGDALSSQVVDEVHQTFGETPI